MPVPIIDTLSRGRSGVAAFPISKQEDLRIPNLTVVDLSALNAIPEWKRIAYMTVYVVSEGKDYQLGADITIAGQTWGIKDYGVPANVVTEDEIFDANGYIQPQLIQNIFLNSSYVVASEAAMLALTSYVGNIFIRTDVSDVFIKLNNDNPADISDFAVGTAGGAVLSVNGQIGVVNITMASLLAVPANQTTFDNAVTTSPTILDHSSAITALQNDVTDINADLSSLLAYVDTNLGTKLLSATAQNPTIAQNGYVIKWDNASDRYVLAPDLTSGGGGGSSYIFENGLTDIAGIVGLGGTLTTNIVLDNVSNGVDFLIGDYTVGGVAYDITGGWGTPSIFHGDIIAGTNYTVLYAQNLKLHGLDFREM
jgi:hypothetical protein